MRVLLTVLLIIVAIGLSLYLNNKPESRCDSKFTTLHETGLASWYGKNLFHGKQTSNQEIYDQYGYTVAHPTLPNKLPKHPNGDRGTMICIVSLVNGEERVARVNDNGPREDYVAKGRIVDLSKQLAIDLGTFNNGTGRVQIWLP